jgi:hypothetical protein
MSATAFTSLELPEQIGLNIRTPLGFITQLRCAASSVQSPPIDYTFNTTTGRLYNRASGSRLLLVDRKVVPPNTVDEVLLLREGRPPHWLKPIPITDRHVIPGGADALPSTVSRSWINQFSYIEERSIDGTVIPGLRSPQIGALYAVLAHWRVSDEPANIVMPTGTGKTETMLAILAKERLPKLLVVVPTDALRDQLSRKFKSWGVLRQFGVIGDSAHFPVVGTLTKIPPSLVELADFFEPCNVVVTTMAITGRAPEFIQAALANTCSHLFIDEAHHIKAPNVGGAQRPLFTASGPPIHGNTL